MASLQQIKSLEIPVVLVYDRRHECIYIIGLHLCRSTAIPVEMLRHMSYMGKSIANTCSELLIQICYVLMLKRKQRICQHAMKRGSSNKSGGQNRKLAYTTGTTQMGMPYNATHLTLQVFISEFNYLYCDYATCHRLNHHTTTMTLLHPTYWIELSEKLLNVMHGK